MLDYKAERFRASDWGGPENAFKAAESRVNQLRDQRFSVRMSTDMTMEGKVYTVEACNSRNGLRDKPLRWYDLVCNIMPYSGGFYAS
jgi:hypothetical protein